MMKVNRVFLSTNYIKIQIKWGKNYIHLRLFENSHASVRSWGRFRPPPPLGHPLARRREEVFRRWYQVS